MIQATAKGTINGDSSIWIGLKDRFQGQFQIRIVLFRDGLNNLLGLGTDLIQIGLRDRIEIPHSYI